MELKEIKPSENFCLDKDELEFFYKILLLCESKGRKPKGYDFGNKKLKNFMVENNFDKVNHVNQVLKNSQCNEIKFTKCQNAVCTSLFVHLRDAFAHGYIEKDIKTNCLHFQNFYRGQCKMDGKMTFENLKLLITNMLNTKK